MCLFIMLKIVFCGLLLEHSPKSSIFVLFTNTFQTPGILHGTDFELPDFFWKLNLNLGPNL